MKFWIYIFGLSLILISNTSLNAQTSANKDTLAMNLTPIVTKELDTEESFKYMGAELLFQLKKRLHLTSEEEEKEKSKKKEKVSVTFFGIKIERE